MKKYFFDIVAGNAHTYDFHGRDFAEEENAFQLAHLLALDVEVGSGDECVRGSINVHNAAGHQLFSVPIAMAA